jgi:hypothetical protein
MFIGGGEFQNDKIMAAFRAFEAYDPASNTWDQSLPHMRIPRHGFAGAVIDDQLHVVAGDIQTAGIPGSRPTPTLTTSLTSRSDGLPTSLIHYQGCSRPDRLGAPFSASKFVSLPCVDARLRNLST